MHTLLRRLPVFRAYAALSDRSGQIQALKEEKDRLRRRVETLRERVAQLEVQCAGIGELRERAVRFDELQRSLASRSEVSADLLNVISWAALQRALVDNGQQYRQASPFPHIVIENLLDPTIVRHVADEFDRMDRTLWRRTSRPTERKLSIEDPSAFGALTRRVIAELNGSAFLGFLESLTGIRGLIADPHLRGGGLHEIERGGFLGVHADFNHYERLNLWRRLNLLIYLNTEWQDEWGGHLELWDAKGTTCLTTIAPLFNRAVVFDTSNLSYHGHPHPLNVPEGGSRKSLALYYYTVDYPYEADRAPHSTLFVQAPAQQS